MIGFGEKNEELGNVPPSLIACEEIREDFKGANQILQEKNDFHAPRECVTIGKEKVLQIVYNNNNVLPYWVHAICLILF